MNEQTVVLNYDTPVKIKHLLKAFELKINYHMTRGRTAVYHNMSIKRHDYEKYNVVHSIMSKVLGAVC